MIQVLELNIRKFCFLEFHNAIKAGSPLQCASRVAGIIISQIYSALLNFHLKFGEILQRWSQFRRIYLHQPTLNWVPIKAWAKVKLNFSICTNVKWYCEDGGPWQLIVRLTDWQYTPESFTSKICCYRALYNLRTTSYCWTSEKREFSKPLCCPLIQLRLTWISR